MAYAVDWIGKVVTIAATDLTLKSGNEYNLDMSKFHIEIRRLESSFDGGLWADNIIDHDNTKIDFAGADYAPFDEVVNDYQVKFELGAIQRVNLIGSNNNIVDVLVFTGVSVVPSNSAGLQVATVYQNVLTPEESTQLLEISNRLDMNTAKPNTYANDGSSISNDDFTLTKTDNGNGTSTVQRS